MKLDKLPDSIADGIDKYEHPVILFFLNHILESGEARIEYEVSANVWRGTEFETGRRRLIIELE